MLMLLALVMLPHTIGATDRRLKNGAGSTHAFSVCIGKDQSPGLVAVSGSRNSTLH